MPLSWAWGAVTVFCVTARRPEELLWPGLIFIAAKAGASFDSWILLG